MSIAQNISARCQRYLGDMGIDLQVWVHAMETPHDKLFVFKPDELKSLNIVTAGAAPLGSGAGCTGRPQDPFKDREFANVCGGSGTLSSAMELSPS